MELSIEEIKNEISRLSEQHKRSGDELEDIKDTDILESLAQQLIIDYCEKNKYQVNGFPLDKKKLPSDEIDEDYFCRDRYQLYLDILTTQHNDVANLMWHYVSNFWDGHYENIADYLMCISQQISSGTYYEVEL